MKALHEQYEDVVRIGPNKVSICSAEAVLQVTGGNSLAKGQSYLTTASGNAQVETSLISIRDHSDHTMRRWLWNKAFSVAALKGYQSAVYVRLDELLSRLDKYQGQRDRFGWVSLFMMS